MPHTAVPRARSHTHSPSPPPGGARPACSPSSKPWISGLAERATHSVLLPSSLTRHCLLLVPCHGPLRRWASCWNPPELPGLWYWLVLAPAPARGELDRALCWAGLLPAGLLQPLPRAVVSAAPTPTLLPAFHVTTTLLPRGPPRWHGHHTACLIAASHSEPSGVVLGNWGGGRAKCHGPSVQSFWAGSLASPAPAE